MALKETPERTRHLLGWTDSAENITAMGRKNFAARLLGRFMECIRAGFDERCLLLDYENLNEERIRAVAAHFGMELPSSGRVRSALQIYSKDFGGRRHHLDDRQMKRTLAGRAVFDAAQRWAMRPYFHLRAL